MPILIFLSTFYLYLTTLCPTIYTGDSAELTTACITLGIPHAPGYPLYCLIGKLFQPLIPWGNPAYRINLMNAVLASLSLVVFYLTTVNLSNAYLLFLPNLTINRNLVYKKILPLSGVGLFAVAPLFWQQSLVTEVFILNVFLISLLVWLIQQSIFYRLKNNVFPLRYGIAAAFLFGLAAGNQHTIIIFLPATIIVYLILFYLTPHPVDNLAFSSTSPRANKKLINYFLLILFFGTLGFTVNLYLLLRSKSNPIINFGHPDTLSRWIAVLTRREFGSFQLHPTQVPFFDGNVSIKHLTEYISHLYTNFALFLPLSIYGFYLTLKKVIFPLGIFTGVSFGLGVVFILYSNLMPSPISFWRMQRFYLINDLIVSLWIVIGLSGIIYLIPPLVRGRKNGSSISPGSVAVKDIGNRPIPKFLGSVPFYTGRFWSWDYFILTLILLPVLFFSLIKIYYNFNRLSLRACFTVYDFGRNILRSIRPNGILFVDSKIFDEMGSAIHYCRNIEQRRKDLTFYYRSGTMMSNENNTSSVDNWHRQLAEQSRTNTLNIERRVIDAISPTRPVHYLAIDKDSLPLVQPGERFKLTGLVYSLLKPNLVLDKVNNINTVNIIEFYTLRNLPEHQQDYSIAQIVAHYPYFYGKFLWESGQNQPAHIMFNQAVTVGYNMEWLYANIGSLLSRSQEYSLSEQYYRTAYSINPYFPYTLFGLGYLTYLQKKYPEAIDLFSRAVRVKKDYAEAYYNLGVVLMETRRYSEAKDYLLIYLRLVPDSPYATTIHHLLGT